MKGRKFAAAALAVVLALPAFSVGTAAPAASAGTKEITIQKDVAGNPLFPHDEKGNTLYGGDPSVLVDGDTVYAYVGHDESTDSEVDRRIYNMKEYICFSTQDMKTWKNEGPVFKVSTENVSWAADSSTAWASQVAKYKDKYYLYFCTWDKTSAGKQSIGVAVSDSPVGPFTDSGKPIVRGTETMPQVNNWDDIDPTVWIEKDSTGTEHRYLAWGNSRYYVCEMNEDMISVKDRNGDGKITCGTSADSADIVNQTPGVYTEAPWLYRRTDENGEYTGPYYLFYASGWRERMAYSTTDDLMKGDWKAGNTLMTPTATSNTNHMAVFDFKGKTYFMYHNGSQPGGNGYRRTACLTELHFNEDGSVRPMQETACGLTGTTSALYTNSGALLEHEFFENSGSDTKYPYNNKKVGVGIGKAEGDNQWLLMAGKADSGKDSYVSIQSENKPGLYITAQSKAKAVLAQDVDAKDTTAKKQTFKTVQGLDDEKGVSFESVAYPGYYLSISNGKLVLANGTDKGAATFYLGIDKDDTSLRSVAATIKKNEILQGDKKALAALSKNISMTAAYANGTVKASKDFVLQTSSVNVKKTGMQMLTLAYTEGTITKYAAVPVTVIVKPLAVKKLTVKVSVKKKKVSAAFKWKKAAGQKYEISYGTKKSQHKKLGTVSIRRSKTYSRSVKTWKKGKKYYFHIRTYSTVNGKKKYSKYKTIKTKISKGKK